MFVVKNLKKTYIAGKVRIPALRGLSFKVKRGEFLAIMGASGSGKSTLLHLMALLDRPTGGKVFLEGLDLHSLSQKEQTEFRLKEFGYIFQNFALVRELTALENVYLPAMMNQGKERAYKQKAKKLLEEVGLGNRLHHLPSELSGGEQQRVAIARALINEPQVIFADEPTANIDSKKSLEVVNLLRRLNKEYKQTIIMVTHERPLGKKADRILWLRDGRVVRKPY